MSHWFPEFDTFYKREKHNFLCEHSRAPFKNYAGTKGVSQNSTEQARIYGYTTAIFFLPKNTEKS